MTSNPALKRKSKNNSRPHPLHASALRIKLCKIIWFCLTAILLLTNTAPSHAQSNSKDPVEITADHFFEWRRAEKIFIAEGNAKAQQGATSIEAGTLRANYLEGKNKKGMEINEVGATGAVIIRSKQNAAYGDYATYDLPKGYAEMTGQNLRMTSPDQTLTARDRFEYWVNDGRLLAIGNAKVTRPKPNGGGVDTLQSDTIIATLREKNGKREIDTLEAKDNVIITTPAETVTGAYAIYHASTNKVELQGNVKITRGPNILTGTRAEVDLNTNVSKIFGSNTSSGRVRGVFYPGSNEDNTQGQQFQPAPSQPQQQLQAPAPIPTPQPFTNPAQQTLTAPKPQTANQPPVEILLPPQKETP